MARKPVHSVYRWKTNRKRFRRSRIGFFSTLKDKISRFAREKSGFHWYFPRWMVVKSARKIGEARIRVTIDSANKTMVIHEITFDENISSPQSFRRVKEMLLAAEKKAALRGVKKVLTDWTIISPRVAANFDFVLVGQAGPKYRYEKVLT